ncbi:DUF2303 family protein [Undibacterium sp. Di24W]|uniref:DUF2303 family protein n=1 Tax=Undibacterium sp. Di24W TaxID=3413033 RepID=UPI003BF1C311
MDNPVQALQGGVMASATADQLHITADTIDRITELAHASVCTQTTGGITFALLPEGYKTVDLTKEIEQAQPAPNRKKGTIQLTSIDSFLQFIADQNQAANAYIYANPEAQILTAVFNDNKEHAIGWRDHRATFKAELSREFANWMQHNKVQMPQESFAIFLEDNIADIVEPSGEVLLGVATSLQAKTEVAFNSAKRLDNGQVQFMYTENIDARAGNGTLEIPREFALGIRIFKNGDGYKVKARLKYRLHSQNLKFWYELDRPENVIETAFKESIEKAQASGYTVLFGSP